MSNEGQTEATASDSLTADSNSGWFLGLMVTLVVLLSGLLVVTCCYARRCYGRYMNSGTATKTTTPASRESNQSTALRFFGANDGRSIQMASRTAFQASSSNKKHQEGDTEDQHEESSGWSSRSEDSSTASSETDNGIDNHQGIHSLDLETDHQRTMTSGAKQEIPSKSSLNTSVGVVTNPTSRTTPTTTFATALTSSALAMDCNHKAPKLSFGELAYSILIGGDKRSLPSPFPDGNNDAESVYSGSALSIFGGSSLASDDFVANQRGSGLSQSRPRVVPDAVSNWFAFKLEAGLSDEDDEHPHRLSVLVSKTLRPVRVQL